MTQALRAKLNLLKNADWLLAGTTLTVMALGLLTIFTSTYEGQVSSYALRQSLFAALGLVVSIFVTTTDYRILRNLALPLYIVSLTLLVVVLLAGKTAYGATSWLQLGPFQFEPAEPAKLALVVLLARFFAPRTTRSRTFMHIIVSGVFLALPLVLVMLQPDLGTSLVLIFVYLVMLFTARPKLKQLVLLALCAAVVLPASWFMLKDYQKSRLTVFADMVSGRPISDDAGKKAAYNVIQSQIAIGSGEITGRGLGRGTQSYLKFLPVQSQQTDFMFSVYAEQMGFIGTVVLLGLYALLLVRAFRAAALARDAFGMFIAVGIGAMLLFHTLLNIAFNMGIAPVTGIPLPLLSYGGTSLLTVLISIGLLQSIIIRQKDIRFGA